MPATGRKGGMYDTRFGLRRRPFRPIPDTDSYFPAATHEAALNHLRRALDDDEGVILLTGEAGTGKTLVARRLLEELDENTRSVLRWLSITSGEACQKMPSYLPASR